MWRAITTLDCNLYYLLIFTVIDCNFTGQIAVNDCNHDLQYYQWQCTVIGSTWELRHDEWLQSDRNLIVNICSVVVFPIQIFWTVVVFPIQIFWTVVVFTIQIFLTVVFWQVFLKYSTNFEFLSGMLLLRNINGSSCFYKGPRTSKVSKSADPSGPWTFRLY